MFSLHHGHLRSCALNLFKKRCSLRFTSHKGAYDGDGKTTVTILNKDWNYGLMVDSLSVLGFSLNIGVKIVGPMILFPKTVLGWNLRTPNDINEDSLVLFKILEPRPDILVLGLDREYPRHEPFIVNFQKVVKKMGMSYEILPVEKACHTFNFLNAESRYVVGLFLPPRQIEHIDHVLIQKRSTQEVLDQQYRNPFFEPDDYKKQLNE
ncbi:NADH dehydrogenase [ubiquinone] 1 alpha subcomplex assembly factor 3 [Chelonus insularis]|uniref:NADH dehydrogenase [ubiquinone] 1 alpha subcomplex assembly factor 3 n=1 Tax=Chelonus insularis TaxID=460826 RepID=UPI00158CF073|nr:NADH dehydrogenase [ubiquinone] 1 alpha subcomplex assembly factor 3 [Chelonus insularis]